MVRIRNSHIDFHIDFQRGFTLIELSIVLVIIGLIVGGVLVGRDLIAAAQIRATVGQIEKYNAAVNTFRGKYNALPGDMTNPAAFGFAATHVGTSSTWTSSTNGMGDGNGLIDSYWSPSVAPAYSEDGETYLFWTHLQQANLIAELSTMETDYNDNAYAIIGGHVPAAKLGGGNGIFVGSSNGLNYFNIAADQRIANVTLTPVQAFQIDTKTDDGIPDTGTVVSIALGQPQVAPIGGGNSNNSNCYNTSLSPHAYSVGAAAQTGQCALAIRATF